MNPILIRSMVVVSSAIVVAGSAYAVLETEKDKRIQKAVLAQADHQRFTEDWNRSHEEFLIKIEEERAISKQQMIEVKKQYEDLLAQQPAIIKEHTRTEQRTENVKIASSEQIGTVTGSGTTTKTQTVKKTVPVSKPSSTPKTSSS